MLVTYLFIWFESQLIKDDRNSMLEFHCLLIMMVVVLGLLGDDSARVTQSIALTSRLSCAGANSGHGTFHGTIQRLLATGNLRVVSWSGLLLGWPPFWLGWMHVNFTVVKLWIKGHGFSRARPWRDVLCETPFLKGLIYWGYKDNGLLISELFIIAIWLDSNANHDALKYDNNESLYDFSPLLIDW